ncbi:MAG: ribosome biogenesis factor YjgA [Lysobacteraceae bacterium]
MRGKDFETGEFLSPSRSQQRREALEVLELARRLSELTAQQIARLPVPERLIPHIDETRRIPSHGAHKRQLQFLAKQMRREDDETLEEIRDALDSSGESARLETAMLHRAEAWRERLMADGDAALTELLDEHPHADRQHLRQLARNAHEEKLRNKPPHAYRELFRELRELLSGKDSGEGEDRIGMDDSDEV